jgi:hypothetical protein
MNALGGGWRRTGDKAYCIYLVNEYDGDVTTASRQQVWVRRNVSSTKPL